MYYEMMKFLAVLVLLLFFAEPSSADVYKWTDENGLIHYSSKKAKKYLRRQGIPFTEYDVEKGSRAKSLYKELGATGVPVILVGKKRMNGFSEAGFERIYK